MSLWTSCYHRNDNVLELELTCSRPIRTQNLTGPWRSFIKKREIYFYYKIWRFVPGTLTLTHSHTRDDRVWSVDLSVVFFPFLSSFSSCFSFERAEECFAWPSSAQISDIRTIKNSSLPEYVPRPIFVKRARAQGNTRSAFHPSAFLFTSSPSTQPGVSAALLWPAPLPCA